MNATKITKRVSTFYLLFAFLPLTLALFTSSRAETLSQDRHLGCAAWHAGEERRRRIGPGKATKYPTAQHAEKYGQRPAEQKEWPE
jgi:hypothetical protein